MENKFKLTIAILTMNRAEQMKEAIESCVLSRLPEKTQFVIVDNASSDSTPDVVEQLRQTVPYEIVYLRQSENKGVGGGRNVCFDASEGEYVYFLDDDAQIAPECYDTFFVSSVEYLDNNKSVATLTTDVVDNVFGERKISVGRTQQIGGLACAYTFHGSTFFIRRSCFKSPLFVDVMYGAEELSASVDAIDRGYCNVYKPDVHTNHLPKVDKWNIQTDHIKMLSIGNIYTIKKLKYPWIFRPLLYFAYISRIRKNGVKDKVVIKESQKKAAEVYIRNKGVRKIKIRTVIKCFREFGFTTF